MIDLVYRLGRVGNFDSFGEDAFAVSIDPGPIRSSPCDSVARVFIAAPKNAELG